MTTHLPASVPSELETPGWHARFTASDWKQARTHLWILAVIVTGTAVLRFRQEWVMGLSLQCVVRSVFHLKCPFCGMTRDFVAILHGQHPEQNPFSWLAVVVIYFVYPAVFVWAWLNRKLDVFYRPVVYRVVAVGLVLMFVLNNLLS